MSSATKKSHVSDISYKAYMGKNTLTMSTIIILFYSCMVTMCICIFTGLSKNSRLYPQYMCTKNLVLYGYTLSSTEVYRLQYKHLAKALSMTMIVMLLSYVSIYGELSSRPTIACSIWYVQLVITFTLNIGIAIASYLL